MNDYFFNKQTHLIESGLRLRIVHYISLFIRRHHFRGCDRLMKLLSKLVPSPKGYSIVPTCNGFDIIVNPVIDKELEKSIYYHGTYELGILNIMEKCLRKGDNFVDVGSNIEFMSLFAS